MTTKVKNEVYRVLNSNRNIITACFGNKVIRCISKTPELSPVVNDLILVNIDTTPISIKSILPRKNIFFRKELKTKIISVNLDHIFLIISGEPKFTPNLLLSVLLRALDQNIPISLVLNKKDLIKEFETAKKILLSLFPCYLKASSNDLHLFNQIFSSKLLENSNTSNEGLIEIKKKIQEIHEQKKSDKAICFIGQSGSGKSSLIKKIIPDADPRIGEISNTRKKGKHTTTTSYAYSLKKFEKGFSKLWIIDTPGIENFGISDLSLNAIQRLFPDFSEIVTTYGPCKFSDCKHDHEPGCTIKRLSKAYSKSSLDKSSKLLCRLELWRELTRTLMN
ncbi:MAG: ribosome small subunit-dependent GTPase A [Betaproteobacteria bacterium TMED82]|nr:MAG: ribosome small subunit-dependent GTPase A [Betaproteobacteria bacterium TMED82]|tara:strand:- start:110920 stop:111924 length:1005 start_codon:yes stop_codon:yes gene_type:complete